MTQRRTLTELSQQIYTRHEILTRGITEAQLRSQVARGELSRLHRNIYLETAVAETLQPWERHNLTTLVAFKSSPGTVFSHESAAALWELPLIRRERLKVHIYCSENSRGRLAAIPKAVRHVRLTPATPTLQTSLGAYTTDHTTTVIDCAQTMLFDQATVLADAVVWRGLLTIEQLRSCLFAYSGRNKAKVHRVAQSVSALAESPGETLVRLQLDVMGLRYIEQYEVWVAGHLYRGDFYLEEHGVFIEFDGMMKYTEYGATDRVLVQERQREKDLTNAGFRVFRVNWSQIFLRPQAFSRSLTGFLRTRP